MNVLCVKLVFFTNYMLILFQKSSSLCKPADRTLFTSDIYLGLILTWLYLVNYCLLEFLLRKL